MSTGIFFQGKQFRNPKVQHVESFRKGKKNIHIIDCLSELYQSVKFANNDFELELGLVPAFSHVSSSLHPKNEMAIKTAPEQRHLTDDSI